MAEFLLQTNSKYLDSISITENSTNFTSLIPLTIPMTPPKKLNIL